MATRVMVPEPCGSCRTRTTELTRTGDLRTRVQGSRREVLHAAIGKFGFEHLALYCRKCGDFGVLMA